MRDNCLLLTAPRYKRITKKETITSRRESISEIPSPISIRICYQTKRGRTKVVKALKQWTLEIMNDAKHNNIVSSTRSKHELTHNMNISNIRTSNSKIYKTTNQLAIESIITQWSTISGWIMSIRLNGSANSLSISESYTRNKISGILGLR